MQILQSNILYLPQKKTPILPHLSEFKNKSLSQFCMQDTNTDNVKYCRFKAPASFSDVCLHLNCITLSDQLARERERERERERMKCVSKSGATSYNKFALVPSIRVGETFQCQKVLVSTNLPKQHQSSNWP
jgi:hypothetical protein